HCSPPFSINAACTGCRLPLLANPSTVVTACPSASTASSRQDETGSPFTSTVQAPQWPVLHPSFVPVRLRLSRSTSRSVRCGSTARASFLPFTVSSIVWAMVGLSSTVRLGERCAQRPPRQHANEVAPELRRGAHVGERLRSRLGLFSRRREQGVAWFLPREQYLYLRYKQRGGRHRAQSQPRGADAARFVQLQRRRHAYHRDVHRRARNVPHVGRASARLRSREDNLAQQLAGRERRPARPQEKASQGYRPLAIRPGDDGDGVQRQQGWGSVCRGRGVAQ